MDGLLNAGDLDALLLSLRVALAAVGLCALPAILLGTWLARSRSRWRPAVEAFVLAPLVIPPVVTGLGLLTLVAAMRVPIAFTWWAAVLASAVAGAPLLVRVVRSAVETVDPRLALVAATLGASRTRVLLTVTLPMVWPAVAGGVMLAWARAFGEFGATLVVAGNIAGRTRTLPLAMYTDWMSRDRSPWPLAVVAVATALGAVAAGEWLIRQVRRSRGHVEAAGIQAA